MIEMTMSEYCKHMLLKHFEEEAAKQGIKLVDKKPKPTLVTDNVVKLERPSDDQSSLEQKHR